MNKQIQLMAKKNHEIAHLKHSSLINKRINKVTVTNFTQVGYGRYHIIYKRDCGHIFHAYYYKQLERASEKNCNRCPKKLYIYQGKLQSRKELRKLTGYSFSHQLPEGQCIDSIVDSMRSVQGRQYQQVGDEVLSMAEAARRLGISRQAIDIRLKTGWDREKAYTQPKTLGRLNAR
jgi:hypothetical protein